MAGLMDGRAEPSGLMGPFGVPTREPTIMERQFFRQNPSVSGYAAPDNSVVMSPLDMPDVNKNSVAMNEASRVFMRQNPNFTPAFSLTEGQRASFAGTPYATADLEDQRATIAGRLLSGDPSAGQPTAEQMEFVDRLRREMFRRALSVGSY